jgi:hypothetical protein
MAAGIATPTARTRIITITINDIDGPPLSLLPVLPLAPPLGATVGDPATVGADAMGANVTGLAVMTMEVGTPLDGGGVACVGGGLGVCVAIHGTKH